MLYLYLGKSTEIRIPALRFKLKFEAVKHIPEKDSDRLDVDRTLSGMSALLSVPVLSEPAVKIVFVTPIAL